MSDSSIPDPSSVVIPPEAIAAIDGGFAAFDQYMLPYLESDGNDDHRGGVTLGDSNQPFVDKVAVYVDTHPEFMPAYADTDAFKRRLARFQQLKNYQRRLDEYKSLVDDSVRRTGNEVMTGGALPYYKSTQEAANSKIPAAVTIAQDLG